MSSAFQRAMTAISSFSNEQLVVVATAIFADGLGEASIVNGIPRSDWVENIYCECMNGTVSTA